jgi:hypothetical protein
MRRRRLTLLVVLVVAGFAIGTAAATGAFDQATAIRAAIKAAGPSAGSAPGAVLAPGSSLLQQFGVLRRARRADDALPPDARQGVAEAMTGLYGVNPDGARLALTVGSKSVYLVPGGQNLCAIDESGAGSCQGLADIDLGRLFTVAFGPPDIPPGHYLVYGAAPDGVSSVIVSSTLSGRVAVPVKNNGWLVDVKSMPTAVQLGVGPKSPAFRISPKS